MARMIITYSEKHTEEFLLTDEDGDKIVKTVENAMNNSTTETFVDTGFTSDPNRQPLVKVNGKLVRSVRVLP